MVIFIKKWNTDQTWFLQLNFLKLTWDFHSDVCGTVSSLRPCVSGCTPTSPGCLLPLPHCPVPSSPQSVRGSVWAAEGAGGPKPASPPPRAARGPPVRVGTAAVSRSQTSNKAGNHFFFCRSSSPQWRWTTCRPSRESSRRSNTRWTTCWRAWSAWRRTTVRSQVGKEYSEKSCLGNFTCYFADVGLLNAKGSEIRHCKCQMHNRRLFFSPFPKVTTYSLWLTLH